jgi:hypothetical protein
MEPSDKLLPVAEHALWSQECLRRENLRKLGISPLISRFDGVGSKSAERLSAPASAAVPKRISEPTSDTPERSRDQVLALLREGSDSATDKSSAAATKNLAPSSMDRGARRSVAEEGAAAVDCSHGSGGSRHQRQVCSPAVRLATCASVRTVERQRRHVRYAHGLYSAANHGPRHTAGGVDGPLRLPAGYRPSVVGDSVELEHAP